MTSQTAPISAPDLTSLQVGAYALGRQAQLAGAQEVPAQDADLLPLMQGLAMGQAKPVLEAWVRGYRHQQDEQQIRQFAARLGQSAPIEQQLQAGLSDAARTALWWQLFDQLPDNG